MKKSIFHERAVFLGDAIFSANDGTITTFFLIGPLGGKFTKKGWIRSGLEMFVIGGFAALLAYFSGFILSKYII